MRVLGPLYTSFAPTGAPALAELGHPDVASGRYSCAVRAYGATTSPVSMSPREGALTSHTESPQCPQLNVHSWRAACGTSLQYSPPRLRAHSFQAERPRFVPSRTTAPYLVPQGGRREKQGRGRYVPSRHQGVRSEARTGSLQEQGTYRLDPSNPSGILNSWPNHRIQPKK